MKTSQIASGDRQHYSLRKYHQTQFQKASKFKKIFNQTFTIMHHMNMVINQNLWKYFYTFLTSQSKFDISLLIFRNRLHE